jgi:hypothetical protein
MFRRDHLNMTMMPEMGHAVAYMVEELCRKDAGSNSDEVTDLIF